MLISNIKLGEQGGWRDGSILKSCLIMRIKVQIQPPISHGLQLSVIPVPGHLHACMHTYTHTHSNSHALTRVYTHACTCTNTNNKNKKIFLRNYYTETRLVKKMIVTYLK